MNLTFHLGNQCLGFMPAKPLVNTGRMVIHRTDSHAFCCPLCGEVWGRITTDSRKHRWHFQHRPCRYCDLRDGSPWMSEAGSFLDSPFFADSSLLANNPDLPDALVRWEFEGIMLKLKQELDYHETYPQG